MSFVSLHARWLRGLIPWPACHRWQWDYILVNNRMSDQKEHLERLKIAAGMAKPSDSTALTELTNMELKQKATFLAGRIREIVEIFEQNWDGLEKERKRSNWSVEFFKELFAKEMRRAWRQFETVRVDSIMVADELRQRLPSHVHEKIVAGTLFFRSADDPKAELSISRLTLVPDFPVSTALILAGELEELSTLQLKKLEAGKC